MATTLPADSSSRRVACDGNSTGPSVNTLPSLLEHDDHVRIAGSDIDGVLRGKLVAKRKFLSAVKSASGLRFCSVVFGWDLHDKTYASLGSSNVSSPADGYVDLLAFPDLETFRRGMPDDRVVPFFLVDFARDSRGRPIHLCPRSLLRTVVDQSRSMGFRACGAVEYEFYNYRETPDSLSTKKSSRRLRTLTPGMFGYSLLRPALNAVYVDDIMNTCASLDIPIESFHTETGRQGNRGESRVRLLIRRRHCRRLCVSPGPGVYEVAIEYSDVMRAADRAQIFKTSVKQVGYKYGIVPSFMAKPMTELPGCGGHLHLSLWNEHGTSNLFCDPADPDGMSGVLRHFVAGVLRLLPDILPMYLPNINR
jgi:glutamine synthetase